MNPKKLKLLAISGCITTGLCVSFHLAFPVIWRTDKNAVEAQKTEKHYSAPLFPDATISVRSEIKSARKSYAS